MSVRTARASLLVEISLEAGTPWRLVPGRWAAAVAAGDPARRAADPETEVQVAADRSGTGSPADPNGARGAGRAELSPYRVLIYSHDSFGLGHLRRCRTIAHSLVAQHKKLNVLILSGSPLNLISLVFTIAALVYLADVRPALREVTSYRR